MELDSIYDTGQIAYETTKASVPVDNATEAAAFGYGALTAYIGALGAESGISGREAGDYGTEENFSAAGKGLFAGGAGGTAVGVVHELTDDMAEYGFDVGTSEVAAAGAGGAVGATLGGSTVEAGRRIKDWLTPD
jgi:predicted amino acid dehydrogenase